ncbi:FAD-dependent oxidoreductase [Methanothermobacter wolfeii]|uniref:FAD-dependent oxidoreductase n=1 Tax=Methanothermobacter wolfeii TaxID=145261 RepID=UPI0024B37B95|nr:FAD-dependent oxidoreductase [Methanothermobacter wolfeii]MDI6702623.1 FAD-dependent oxidoreductase [Methanothermobacter wolfeii]MDI6841840.1 FAD-dependent oxidoreductase [Methanothermobacter wolfeii]
MRVVIIGGGAGGLSTASNIRKYDKEADITVITRDKHVAYSPCAIPYVMCGEVESFDDIIMHTPEDYRDRNIKILTETEVEGVSPEKKTVTYRRGEEAGEIPYDVLVIATGGSPFIPPVEGVDLEGVFTIRSLTDGEKIAEWASKSKSAVVVGAGLIGLEMAYGLLRMGLEVTVTEMLPQIVPRSLDPDMAAIVQEYLEEKGIRVILGKALERITGDERVERVMVGDECIDADMVILATGVRPEKKLAEMAGCETGQWAVRVNERMQTSVPDIYAVGDCVEVHDAITGFRTQSPLGSAAVRQAKVAAKNIAGMDAVFRPVLNAMVSKIGELEFGAVGLTEVTALQNGIKVVSGKKRALTKARYYPGAERIDVKMICDLNGRIIGCQIVAKERVAERIDTMSLAISQGMTCAELAETEFSYAPPVSMVIDPIILAAEDACEKLKRVNNKKAE